jgi:hypothetical protein
VTKTGKNAWSALLGLIAGTMGVYGLFFSGDQKMVLISIPFILWALGFALLIIARSQQRPMIDFISRAIFRAGAYFVVGYAIYEKYPSLDALILIFFVCVMAAGLLTWFKAAKPLFARLLAAAVGLVLLWHSIELLRATPKITEGAILDCLGTIYFLSESLKGD